MLSADPTVPAPLDPNSIVEWWDATMVAQPKSNPSVVFVGDSITWGYEYGTGAPVWSAYLNPLSAADYGVPSQTTETLLFQLSLGQLTGMSPSVVVLMIGTNNLIQDHDTPQQTTAGILADINAIHLYQPQAQVLVLGVPPGEASPNDPYRAAVSQTDALVSQEVAGDPRATFVNIAPAFVQSDGSIPDSILFDGIHPTEQGYLNMTNVLLAPMVDAAMASANRIL